MPFGDRTGPAGYGPRTGRAAGYCSGYGVPGSMNPAPGTGFGGWGYGFGRGRGWRNRFYATGLTGWQRGYPAGWPGAVAPPAGYGFPATPSADQEVSALKSQAKYFEDALGEIRKRIGDLEAQSAHE